MIPTLTARFSTLHVSSNVARARLTPTATRSVFIAARSKPIFQLQARTFLNSAAAESPAKKSTSSESSEDKPKKATTKKAATTKAKSTKAAAKTSAPKPKKVEKKPAKLLLRQIADGLLVITSVPKLPRWPANSFIYWYTKKFLPTWSGDLKSREAVSDAARAAGEAWKNVTEAEKLQLNEEVAVKRAEAKKAREEFLSGLPLDTFHALNRDRVAKGKARVRTPGSLKRPSNPYVHFTVEYMAQERNGRVPSEVVKAGAEKWKSLSEAEKRPYVEAYEREYAEWQARHAESATATGKV